MSAPQRFNLAARVLHWLMAASLIAMLFIGVTMVSSLGRYSTLVQLHRPLGVVIGILAVLRLVNRWRSELPPFLPTMSERERRVASISERLLYALMLSLPLVGWGMLSAGNYPIVLCGGLHLPHILPAQPFLFAVLRRAHTVLAYLLFFTIVAHVGGVLFHTLVLRDGLLRRMTWGKHPPG